MAEIRRIISKEEDLTANYRAEHLRLCIKSVFNPTISRNWALLTREREADVLMLKWESNRGKSYEFSVVVVIYEISLNSNPGLTPIEVTHRSSLDGG